jgi:hypothetical protein
METKNAANHRKMPMLARQLPITGFAHKAGVVSDADLAAVLAAFGMAAQGGGATGFDGAHDAPLAQAQVPCMLGAVGRLVAAEDIRHLQVVAHGG